MCSIVAGVSSGNILGVFPNGLKRLEYRGYDSCGIATVNNNVLTRLRMISRIEMLEQDLNVHDDLPGRIGVAHTRWATHGASEI